VTCAEFGRDNNCKKSFRDWIFTARSSHSAGACAVTGSSSPSTKKQSTIGSHRGARRSIPAFGFATSAAGFIGRARIGAGWSGSSASLCGEAEPKFRHYGRPLDAKAQGQNLVNYADAIPGADSKQSRSACALRRELDQTDTVFVPEGAASRRFGENAGIGGAVSAHCYRRAARYAMRAQAGESIPVMIGVNYFRYIVRSETDLNSPTSSIASIGRSP